jgi:hypothetical protein
MSFVAMDLTFDDISPWLLEPVTDITALENWMGNKLYGIETGKELVNLPADRERALEIAKIFKERPPMGIVTIGDWGTFICPTGPAGPAQETGAEIDKIKIPNQTYFIIPLAKGETRKLKIKLRGKLRIDKKSSFTVEVAGGELGIVIDTHGR